jgi:hypothetical protein
VVAADVSIFDQVPLAMLHLEAKQHVCERIRTCNMMLSRTSAQLNICATDLVNNVKSFMVSM